MADPLDETYYPPTNRAPADFDPERDLPPGFMRTFTPLHKQLAARAAELVARRKERLEAAHRGDLPEHPEQAEVPGGDWGIEVPAWAADQRNQMTGPADDAELVVKMLNSGAPGVMLDLEDSMANRWDHLQEGIRNILSALRGDLSYTDRKRGRKVGIEPSGTVIWNRVRGLHLSQAGVLPGGETTPAPLFDVAMIAHQVDPAFLRHPLCFYIPKSESAEEASWWADLFQGVARAMDWPRSYVKAMALVESHPLAYEVEGFLYNLREHIVGLNLGRWDYMASLAHYNLADPRWVLPDRNTIPHDVPFFQRVRLLLADTCHKRGALAIGGMTALYPSREDPELNQRALDVLGKDKRNEADCFMDGAWTGHPDQNALAVAQFPKPNQIGRRPPGVDPRADLRPIPEGVGRRTVEGTRAAVRTVIRYRNGVLNGKGASLLDGYMEDLATDRIYRLMVSQRMRHFERAPVVDVAGKEVPHTPAWVSRVFDEELARLVEELPKGKDVGTPETLREARRLGEEMILKGWFDPQ
jgi:malate synthase